MVTPRLLLQTDVVVLRHGPTAEATDDADTHPGLYLRRARAGADVQVDAWRARLMFEVAAQGETADAGGGGVNPIALDPIAGPLGGPAPRTTEAFIAYAPHPAFALRAGAMRVPLGLSRQIDEGDLRLPERARFIARTTPDFRVGVAAMGDLGLLQYALGSFAVAPRFGSTFTGDGTMHLLRLSGEPVGPMGLAPQLRRRDDLWYGWWRFSVGASAFYAQLPGANELGVGGDAQFQWRRLCAAGELLWTRRAGADRLGFSVEPGVFVVPERIELVARIEWFNDDIGPRAPQDAWGTTLGATFFSTARRVRAQAAYTWRRPFSPTAPGDDHASGWAVLRAAFTL